MNTKIFQSIILVSLIVFTSCSGKKYKSKNNITVAFYNVENLFDVENEPGKHDDEFTPEGQKKWDKKRYNKKLEDITNVLSSINSNELPEIIGLCEVENRIVLDDLCNAARLKEGKYKVIHHESPDFRGIDCALLYRPDEFTVQTDVAIPVKFSGDLDYTTRDILYVKGKTKNREEIHLFINHWPSRIGGLEKTEPKRIAVATILKNKIDSVMDSSPKAKIVVLGDMNDEPDNKSLNQILGAHTPGGESALVNLMYPDAKEKKGSYYYRGNWNMLDNIVISPNLLDSKGFCCVEKKGFVFSAAWMEYNNRNGEMSPNRTYGGPNYYGGVSDHFPVYFKMKK